MEAVLHGKTGFLVDSTKPEKIGEAITGILSDKKKLVKFGENGRELIRSNFQEDIMIQNYIDLLEEVAGL